MGKGFIYKIDNLGERKTINLCCKSEIIKEKVKFKMENINGYNLNRGDLICYHDDDLEE